MNRELKTIYFITGASGVGKTTLLELLKKDLQNDRRAFLHFDSIGIPSLAEMERDFGSPPAWQRFQTLKWIDRLLTDCNYDKVFFEGQVNPTFIAEGFARHDFKNYVVILIDCSEEMMRRRLHINRGQPELYTNDMINWLRYLRSVAKESGTLRLDTTNLTPEQMVEGFKALIGL